MNIILICSAGMSTSLLEKSILDYMAINKFKGVIEAHGSYAAGPRIKDFDIVMLGPQLRFLKDKYKKNTDKIILVIPSSDYAAGNGGNVYNLALKAFKND